MPKPITERATENPLGKKINNVMRLKGMAGDYAALAHVFGVKTPSVYDWVTHGRLGKERYATLVQWSGKSLHWWFDIPEMEGVTASTSALTLHDTEPTYWATPAMPVKSPFARIENEEWARLSPQEVAEIEIFALGYVTSSKSNARATGAGGHAQHKRAS